jgi:hypothetical protein
MRYVIGTINCKKPLSLKKKDIRALCEKFTDTALPPSKLRPQTTREIMVDGIGKPNTRELDPTSQYTCLSLESFPQILDVWRLRYREADERATRIFLAIGSNYFCAVHCVSASLFIEEDQCETMQQLVGEHEFVKRDGDAFWFDSERPDMFFCRNLTSKRWLF